MALLNAPVGGSKGLVGPTTITDASSRGLGDKFFLSNGPHLGSPHYAHILGAISKHFQTAIT